ncbi:MAG TPA: AsmA-like C-terminal region-containing protein, partial [Albitalea sp.]|nr:AsmA-like C-terminal region-containing protein [Albitalea sp.]
AAAIGFAIAEHQGWPFLKGPLQTNLAERLHRPSGDAAFSFDGTGTDVMSFHALDGDAALSGPSLAKVGDAIGLTLPTTAPFTLKGRLGKSGTVWTLKDADLRVGESRLGGQFSVDRSQAVPMLSGALTGERLVLADLLPAFGAPRSGTDNPRPPPGHVLPQRELDIPSLHVMNADVKLRLQRADLGSLFRQPLSPLNGDLSLTSGVLRISNLVARTAGGEATGQLRLDGTHDNPRWRADVRWSGVELDKWLRPRNTRSETPQAGGEKPSYVTGKLGGHADLQARGRSTAQMAASVDGKVQAWVRNGSISHLVVEEAGIDIAESLGLMLTGDNMLTMNCAVINANASSGSLTPEVALIDTDDTTIFVTGSISLADEGLALTMTAKPKDMTPVALRSPVRVQGTFSSPKVVLDKKRIAGRAIAATALAIVNPLAALVPLLDTGDKEKSGGCGQALERLRGARVQK